MTVPTLLYIIGLLFALVVQFQAQGKSLLAWGVIAVCIGLLWGALNV